MFENFYFSNHSLTIFAFLGDDILVHRDKENPDRMFTLDVTEDGKYLVMYILKNSARVRHILLNIINIILTAHCSSKISYG